MSSVRARFGASLACAVAVTLLPAIASPATAAEASTSTARAAVAAPSSDRTTPTASRSTARVSVSKAALRSPAARGKAVISVARQYRGIRYRAGGTTPRSGFDCSGYTKYVFSRLGISLPRVSGDQFRSMTKISRSAAVPGDLVFFHSRNGHVYHAAIYAGGNAVWHSPFPGQRVKLERIWSSSVYFARVRA
jgi:cell wall-associated NlpC family hydrolase